jgi:hypothetical protein
MPWRELARARSAAGVETRGTDQTTSAGLVCAVLRSRHKTYGRRIGLGIILGCPFGGAVMMQLSEHCVYTILHTDRLEEAARRRSSSRFEENRAWVTGHRLWQQAQRAGSNFPILLGDATDCSRLEYWGLLTDVKLKGGRTCYTVDRIRRIDGVHIPQDLVLRSTGKRIAPKFIRPYAICRTPAFLADQK